MKVLAKICRWSVAGLLIVTFTGCPSGDNTKGDKMEGAITIDGSSTVYPITEAMADAFGKDYPKVKVNVAISGTGGGFKRFTKGETDISDASRPIKREEFDACLKNGVSFIEIPVAYDGLSVVVNPANKACEELTVEDLQKIFLDSDDKPMTWADVKEGWPDTEIKIFIPGTDSGTFDYFKEVVVGKTDKSIRSDVSASEDDNVLVTGIASNEGGIGFFGCAYYFENTDKLKGVKIVNSDGKAVLPSAETIESGEYNPLSRPLFIYANADKMKRPEMKKFVDFYIDNAAKQAAAVGYVALPSDVYDQGRDHVKNKQVGTHYLDSQGEKRSGSIVDIYKVENLVTK